MISEQDPPHRLGRREARDAWCAERRVGDLTATFYPGDELRCPGTRLLSGGGRVVCGGSLEGRAKPHSRVIVRVRTGRLVALPHAGTDNRCRHCGSALEVFPILEATG